MKFLYLFITCFWFFKIPWCDGTQLKKVKWLNRYLDQQNLTEKFLEREKNFKKRDFGQFELEHNENVFHVHETENALFFTLSEVVYLLLDSEIFMVSWKDGQLLLQSKNMTLTGIGTEKIDFLRATDVEKADLLLLRFKSGNIQIHNITSGETVWTLQSPFTVDAKFFKNNKEQYLVILNNKEDNLTESIIYKWQKSKFVDIRRIFTIGAEKVASFTVGKSEILIVLQKHSANKIIEIFEFKNEIITSIQNLTVSNPVNVDTFTNDNTQYVVVYEKTQNNTLYHWNGEKLQDDYHISTKTVISNSVILNNVQNTFVFTQKKEHLEVYEIAPKIDHIQNPIIYTSNFSKILDLVSNRNEFVLVAGVNQNRELTIGLLSIGIRKTETPVTKNPMKQYLRECFNDLEQKVYDLRRLQSNLKEENMENMDEIDESNIIVSESLTQEEDLEEKTNTLLNRVQNLTSLLDSQNGTLKRNVSFSKPVVFKGTLKVNKLVGQDVELKEINSKIWTPERWLRYKTPQTITGPVKLASVVTEKLETSSEDPIFKNLVFKNGSKSLSGKIKAKSFAVNNLFVNTINDIDLNDLYLKNTPELITGLKSFRNLNASRADIQVLNKKNMTNDLNNLSIENIIFGKNVTIENLNVERIDGVPWNEFRDSVFKASQTDTIVGNLKIPSLKTISLNLKTLNGIDVKNLFSLSTDQTINSSIKFKRIYAKNIDSNWTNGISLKKSAALADQDESIKGPVTLEKMTVAKKLNLIGSIDKGFLLKNGGRVIGTNESDLLQIYDNVKLKGNLYLKDLSLKPNAKLFISEEELSYNFTAMYWTKSKKQEIPVRVHIQDSLTVPHLITNTLNDIKITQFMRNSNDQEFETEYDFENVTVFGNVILNNDVLHKPDLKKIDKEAVKTKGSFLIHGRKTYEGTLKCKNLVANELEGIKTLDTLKKSVPTNITSNKNFTNIIVKGNVNSSLNRLDKINGNVISEFLQNVVLLDEPQKLGFLNFEYLKANNLQVTTYNDQPIEDFIANQKQLRNVNKIENLIIDGNVIINNVTNVSKINDILFEDIVEKGKQNVGITGGVPIDLRFTGSIEVDNLATFVINDINLFNLTSRFLFRELNQTISAPFSFHRIKAENIFTPRINNKTVENLIDISEKDSQIIYAPKGLTFSNLKILKSVEVEDASPCRLEDVIGNMHNPSTKMWQKIEIYGNMSLLDNENILYRIFEKTVKKNEENDILAPVNFRQYLVTKNVETLKNINGINVSHILEDAVLSNSPSEQFISGRKWYSNLEVTDAIILKNADIAIINNENIKMLNNDIVDKNSIDNTTIKGMKTFFGGLQVDHFSAPSIRGVDSGNIVTRPTGRKIPEAIFDSLNIKNNLNITFVNNLNLSEILAERLFVNGPSTQECDGIYFFDNLKIKDITTPSINKIRISNLVFDDGTVQNITGPKHFKNKVIIFGDLNVELMNGMNITKEFENTLQNDEESVVINGSIEMLRPSIISGNISAEYINGFPIIALQKILNTTNTKEEVEDIDALKNQLLKRIRQNWNMVQFPAKEYLYLEESNDLQIPATMAIEATTLNTRDYVHIHLNGEESGDHCGLPKTCKCPFQNTLIVSPELSVSKLTEKGSQRIFSYDDHLMTVHFITNSVSMSPDCRTDTMRVMNEVSMMSWITASTENSTGKFYQYQDYFSGYIRKVEFFTVKDKTYVIVGRYYDPLMDTYDLNCTIIRFNENRSKAEVIQTIPTKGLQEIFLFFTAQGIRLIIGNIKETEEETEIYTFNQETEQFDLLRKIPYFGCSSATGIIKETDSFIVLKQKYSPVQILKYHPEFDNYYHFQSFYINEPVRGISVFYAGDYGISDVYLCLVSVFEKYFIYSYRHMEGFKLVSNGFLEGLKKLVPIEMGNQNYVIALSAKRGSLLRIVKYSSN